MVVGGEAGGRGGGPGAYTITGSKGFCTKGPYISPSTLANIAPKYPSGPNAAPKCKFGLATRTAPCAAPDFRLLSGRLSHCQGSSSGELGPPHQASRKGMGAYVPSIVWGLRRV